jgi:hypothetical protein
MDNNNPNPIRCAECEAKVMDALDGALSPAEQSAFDRHLSTCAACSRMVADAQRGAAWLEMLKSPRPEPSADLMDRILTQTSGAQIVGVPMPALVPATQPMIAGNMIPFPRRAVSATPLRKLLFQPRLAMTAAMAFFSIALTMNLIGFHPTEIKASQLRPSSLVRDVYQANARIVQYYDNLQFVAQFESHLQELKQTGDPGNNPSQTPTPQKQSQPAPSGGSSRRSTSAGALQISLDRTRSTRQGVSA